MSLRPLTLNVSPTLWGTAEAEAIVIVDERFGFGKIDDRSVPTFVR